MRISLKIYFNYYFHCDSLTPSYPQIFYYLTLRTVVRRHIICNICRRFRFSPVKIYVKWKINKSLELTVLLGAGTTILKRFMLHYTRSIIVDTWRLVHWNCKCHKQPFNNPIRIERGACAFRIAPYVANGTDLPLSEWKGFVYVEESNSMYVLLWNELKRCCPLRSGCF